MELHEYWTIIRRHWWLPAALTLAALVASSIVAVRGAAAYKTEMRLAVSTQPTVDRSNALYYDPIYYANLSSEYLADDLSEVIRSEAFGDEVSRELGPGANAATIAGVTRTKKTHRLIDVTITTATAEQGAAIAGAMERVLNDPARMSRYLKALDAYKSQVSIVNRPVPERHATPLGLLAEVGLRALVALLVGIALAFLLDYVDPTVRTRQDAEQAIELPVLGEIPRYRHGVAA